MTWFLISHIQEKKRKNGFKYFCQSIGAFIMIFSAFTMMINIKWKNNANVHVTIVVQLPQQ